MVFAVLILSTVFTASEPATTSAANTGVNASVFTGRFIPAFVGGAYDPSEAYSAMTGLPVYVVAFDHWYATGTGASSGSTFIMGDIAIRTQIRADGTFQVQGLPEGHVYGVYFPFTLNGNKVERTDCTDGSGAPARDTFGGVDTNPCKDSDEKREKRFYMPRPEDAIVDVFSYSALYRSSESSSSGALYPLHSQVLTSGGQEQVSLEHIFVTNRKDLDAENNINTFPIMPINTLKVNINAAGESGVQKYNIWAIRVSEWVDASSTGHTNQYIRPTYGPVIKGQMSFDNGSLSGNNYSFMSYAPKGDYVVIAWRQERGSPTYSEWDGKSSLNSHMVGMVQTTVNYKAVSKDQATGNTVYDYVDTWRNKLAFSDSSDIQPNTVWMWGTVTNKAGWLMTSASLHDNNRMLDEVYLKAENVISCTNDSLDIRGIDSTVDNYVPFVGVNTVITSADDIRALRGIYIVKEITDTSKCITDASLGAGKNVPHSARLRVFVDTSHQSSSPGSDLRGYTASFTNSGTLFSNGAPLESNIVTDKAEDGAANPVSGGHKSGIFLYLKKPSGDPFSGLVLVELVNSDEDIAAEGSTPYVIDDTGRGFIPSGDLNPSISTNYETFRLKLRVTDGLRVTDYIVGNDASTQYPWVDSGLGTDNNTELALVCDKSSRDSLLCNGPLEVVMDPNQKRAIPDKYNLAIVNKISAMVNGNTSADTLSDPFTIIVDDVGKLGNAAVNVDVIEQNLLFVPNTTCTECEIYVPSVKKGVKLAGHNLRTATNFGGTFDLLVPPSGSLFGLQRHFDVVLSSVVDKGEEGQVAYTARTEISVDTAGKVRSANPVHLDLSFDCTTAAKHLHEGWIERSLANLSCRASQYFSSRISSAFQLLQDYGLQVAPITRNRAIVNMFDMSRNIVNILFIFIFIVISIMTIMRYQPEKWHIRVLLPKLLLALVLANFSMLIVQAVLDLNNFATATIFDFTASSIKSLIKVNPTNATESGKALLAAGGAGFTAVFSGAIGSIAGGLVGLIFGTGGAGLVGILIMAISVVVAMLLQALILVGLFFMRLVVIWLLLVAAPFVYLLDVTPWFTGLQLKWFNMLLKVSFIQTAVAALLAVGLIFIIMGATTTNSGFAGMLASILIGIVTLKMAADAPKSMLSSLGAGALGGAAAALSTEAVASGLGKAGKKLGGEVGAVSGALNKKRAFSESIRAEAAAKGRSGRLGVAQTLLHRATGSAGRERAKQNRAKATGAAIKAAKKDVNSRVFGNFIRSDGNREFNVKDHEFEYYNDMKSLSADYGFQPIVGLDGRKRKGTAMADLIPDAKGMAMDKYMERLWEVAKEQTAKDAAAQEEKIREMNQQRVAAGGTGLSEKDILEQVQTAKERMARQWIKMNKASMARNKMVDYSKMAATKGD